MEHEGIKLLGWRWKQPGEVVPVGRWGVDFAADLVDGETIVGGTSTLKVYDRESGTDVTATMVDGALQVSGTGISAKFKNGTDGHSYICEVVAKTSVGGVYDGEFAIVVTALP